MRSFELITPEGTKDILFEECLAIRDVENKYINIFKGMGYSEVFTPGIEFYDVFNSGARRYSQEALYKLSDSKGRLITLRPDCTIPIARLVATRLRDMPLPLRLFYTQNVYENNKLLKGRSDEIVQSGIELIGSEYKRADFEVMSIAVSVLKAYKGTDFRLEIGDIGFFKELVALLGVNDNVSEEIRYLIEAKNYPALNDLLDSIGDNNVTKALKKLPSLFGGVEVFDKAAKLVANDKIQTILDNLREFYNSLQKLGLGDKLSVDLGIVNRTDYYTGIVFKGYLSGVGEAVLQGGRYNKLISEFGYDVPATGFAINVNLVAALVRKLSLSPVSKAPDAVIFAEHGYCIDAITYAMELAQKGLVAENAVFEDLEGTIEYCKNKGVNQLHIVSDTVKILTLKDGEYVE
ncbi:MAG: ATP phosphoribosyltransferase regulatory subunit [Oscillospiraceae bacterium]|nr:ATP phosphoribosyltransferase regulatory subunit [Oscillospiraceae bacterium]